MLFLFIWFFVACMILSIVVPLLLSYIKLNDFFWLDLYVVSFFWIIVAGMCMAVWGEVITFYDCKMINILYPIQWLIIYLLSFVRSVFLLNYCSWYTCSFFTRSDFFVGLWNYYYHISIWLIDNWLILYLLRSVCCFFSYESS